MSKMDAVVKLVLFLFVTLLSFSVGTYVGKQFSDAEHRKANLETDQDSRTPASVEEEHDEQEKDSHHETAEAKSSEHDEHTKDEHAKNEEQGESLSQKELDQLAEEFSHQTETERNVASEKPSHDTQEAKAPAHEEVKHEKKDAHGYKSFDRGGKEAKKAVSHEEPTPAVEKEPTSRKPSSLPAVAESATGKYTLQVGSYPTEKDAQEKAKELKAKGWNAFYITADVKGQKWYRLNVGLFNSQKSAQDFKKEYSKETKNNNVLIQKIVQ